MSGDATTQERILRALANGPLYEGVVPLVVHTTPAHARRVLRHLARLGHVTRDDAGTWRLTS